MYSGNLVHNGNLTLGNAPASAVQTIVIHHAGLGGIDPIWNNTNVPSRSYYLYSPNWVPLKQTVVPSLNVHFELVGEVRTCTGTLTMNTHNNLNLTSPVTVGTATSGGLVLTRGIITTTEANILHLAAGNTSTAAGTAPSILTPSTTHGSYVAGPLRRTFPASGAVTREFPLGIGSGFNGLTPNANVSKQVSIATGATGASGQSPTVSIVGAPSGTLSAPA
ncbi:MAG: hypothetical protein U1C33_05890, partial [Candidatus Cloacimonadaceae bacterium]|nr:hypothetical protein [Candidatus Cloacimonadaceae bacterium]